LEGRRVAVDPTLGGVVVHPEIQAIVTAAAEMLIKAARLRQLDVPVSIPTGGLLWGAAGLGAALYTFRDVWPERADDLTDELRFGLTVGEQYYDAKMAAQVERFRVRINEAMADVFDQVDFVICATNPVEAYAAEGPSPRSEEHTSE